MKSIIVCNTASDSISKIDIEKFCGQDIFLKLGGRKKGPRGIEIHEGKVIVTNCYDNSITIIDEKNLREEESYKVGKYPKDIKAFKNYLYISCGESNSVNVFNLKTRAIDYDIGVGDYPSSLKIDRLNEKMYVSNMNGNSISVIDLKENRVVDTFGTDEIPTGIGISLDGKSIYVCQSSFGYEHKNMITIHSEKASKAHEKIKVGIIPSDITIKENRLYTANLGDGSISIVDLDRKEEVKRLYIGGMPREILVYEKYIFVADYYNGRIVRFDEETKEFKSIAVGKEPNAMILTNSHH